MWRIGNTWIPTSRIVKILKDPKIGSFNITLDDDYIVFIKTQEEFDAFDFFMNEVQAASIVDINKMYQDRDRLREVIKEMKERMQKKDA